MPYASVNELPAEVKKLSAKAQSAFRQAFNSAVKSGKSESQAFKIAWSAAKQIGGEKAMEQARTFSTEQRKKLASKGHALPDGSFPIVTTSDLKNAVQAYGRASNKAAAKRHIIKRAKALGATNQLPDDWKSSDSAAETKLYYFEGRNTPIAATSVTDARKKKKRGGDKLVKVRTPTAAEKKKMGNGEWVRTRKDGKSPAKSKHGKGRGYGPPRKKDAATAANTSGAEMSTSLLECPHETCTRKFVDEAHLSDHAASVHTLSEKRMLLTKAVRTVHGREAYLVDQSDDWFIYDVYDEGGYTMYRQSYSLDNAGNVKITGDPAEVVRKVSYIPAPKVETAESTLSAVGITFGSDDAYGREDEKKKKRKKKKDDDEAGMDTAAVESSQTTVELSREGSKYLSKENKPHSFKALEDNAQVCSVCNKGKGATIHGDD